MRVLFYLKKKYRDLIKQLRELTATKKRGYREYKEPSKYIKLK